MYFGGQIILHYNMNENQFYFDRIFKKILCFSIQFIKCNENPTNQCDFIFHLFLEKYLIFVHQFIRNIYYLSHKLQKCQILRELQGKKQFTTVVKKNVTIINKKNTTWTDLANDYLQRSVDCLKSIDHSQFTLAQSFYKMISDEYFINHWSDYQELERKLLQKYGEFNKWNGQNKEKGLNDIIDILTQFYEMENNNEAKNIVSHFICKLEQSLTQEKLKMKTQSLNDYQYIAKRMTSTRQKFRNHIKPLGKSEIIIGIPQKQTQKRQHMKKSQNNNWQPVKIEKEPMTEETGLYHMKMQKLLKEYKEQNCMKKKQQNYDYSAIFQASKLMIKKRSDLTNSKDVN